MGVSVPVLKTRIISIGREVKEVKGNFTMEKGHEARKGERRGKGMRGVLYCLIFRHPTQDIGVEEERVCPETRTGARLCRREVGKNEKQGKGGGKRKADEGKKKMKEGAFEVGYASYRWRTGRYKKKRSSVCLHTREWTSRERLG